MVSQNHVSESLWITDPIYGLIEFGITMELMVLSKILRKLKYLCTEDISPMCILFSCRFMKVQHKFKDLL